MDLSSLTRTVDSDGHLLAYVQAGLVATYYLAAPLRASGPQIAQVLQRYMEFVGPDRLKSYLAENGSYKPLTAKRVQRDLKLLHAMPAGADLSWSYSSAEDSGVGDFKFRLRASEPDEDFPELVSILRLEFAQDAIQQFGAERLVSFAAAVASVLQPQSGHVGWAFKRAEGYEGEATKAINRLLPRYLGFDPCYELACLRMRDHSIGAHWIDFVETALFERCGGARALGAAAPQATHQQARDVVMIRAAESPPIGDANRGAGDLAQLPGVARFLAPVQVKLGGLGDAEFDVSAWLGRFDAVPLADWKNG